MRSFILRHVMCFDFKRKKFVNIAEEGNKVCFISGCEESASYGCMYERAYFYTHAYLCALSLVSKLGKNTPIVSFAFRHELQILLTLSCRDKVNFK